MSFTPTSNGVLGLPAAEARLLQHEFGRVDSVIIGFPWDGGTSGVPGQRHGPEIIRKFGPDLGLQLDGEARLKGVRDPVTGETLLGGKRVFDLGDLGGLPLDPRLDRVAYYRAIEETSTRASRLARTPVYLGGDHSVTAAAVAGAVAELGQPLRLICFDAHCDVGPAAEVIDGYNGVTHANFINYLTVTDAVSSVDVIGVRAPLPEGNFPLPDGVRCHSSVDSLEPPDSGLPTYLSIDVDVLSPESFPATGHPEPGGRDVADLLADVSEICRTFNVVGADIVETTYSDHFNEGSARTVSAILLTILRGVLDYRETI